MFRMLLAVGTGLLFPFLVSQASQEEVAAQLPTYSQPTVYREFAPTKVVQFQAQDGEPMQILSSHASHIPRAQLGHVLEEIPGGVHRDVLFSYSEELQPEINQSARFLSRFKNRFVMPIQRHFAQSTEEDRIGVLILSINTMYDSFLWIHAGNLEAEQKAMMIIFNVLLAGSLGFKKDLWSNMARPLGTRITQFLSYLTQNRGTATQLTGTFLSYVTFSIAIQAVRMSILSLPHLAEAITSFGFWGPAVGLGTLMSLTSLGWNEQLAKINRYEHPIAKSFFQRVMEGRGLLMGTIAPSSKILQPHSYGYLPVVATCIHGVFGLYLLLKSDRVINWIENSKAFQKYYVYHEKVDRWIHDRFKSAPELKTEQKVESCSILFNN